MRKNNNVNTTLKPTQSFLTTLWRLFCVRTEGSNQTTSRRKTPKWVNVCEFTNSDYQPDSQDWMDQRFTAEEQHWMKDNFSQLDAWVRDLTNEGIEPNPGPPKKTKNNKKQQKTTITIKKPQKKSTTSLHRGGGTGLFSGLGSTIGGLLGGPAGRKIGSSAGSWFSKITGMGDYKVRKNNLITNGNGIPTFANSSQGCVVTHREFLTDINGSVGFNLTSFDINPGLASTFPWLSSLAPSFEQYELLGLIFEYRPTCATSVGSTNTAQGVVVMATNYDTLDDLFTSKQQMEAYEFSTSCVPYGSMIHPIECNPRYNSLSNMFVRNHTIPADSDQRFYDAGKFQIATVGMQAANTVGELWVSYSVRLLKPKLPSFSATGNSLWAHVVAFPFGSSTTTNTLGTSASTANCRRTGSTLALTVRNSQTITIPFAGDYVVSVNTSNTGGTNSGNPTITSGANFDLLTVLTGNSASGYGSYTAGSAAYLYSVRVSESGTTTANDLQILVPNSSTQTGGNCDIFVFSVPNLTISDNSSESKISHQEDRIHSLEEAFKALLRFHGEFPSEDDTTENKTDLELIKNTSTTSSSSSSSHHITRTNHNNNKSWF